MAAVSRADANWEGDLIHGGGSVRPASGAFAELPVTWATRAERSEGATSPEELLAAAHAACFCMAFSNGLAKAGHEDIRLSTSSEVEFVTTLNVDRSCTPTGAHYRSDSSTLAAAGDSPNDGAHGSTDGSALFSFGGLTGISDRTFIINSDDVSLRSPN